MGNVNKASIEYTIRLNHELNRCRNWVRDDMDDYYRHLRYHNRKAVSVHYGRLLCMLYDVYRSQTERWHDEYLSEVSRELNISTSVRILARTGYRIYNKYKGNAGEWLLCKYMERYFAITEQDVDGKEDWINTWM